MDFCEEEGEEAGVAVAEDREEGEELGQVVTRSECEGVGGGWEKGEDVSKRTGYVEEFFDQAHTVYFHTLMRELGSHGQEISCNLDRILKGHARIITA
jgi:hypothetical protein